MSVSVDPGASLAEEALAGRVRNIAVVGPLGSGKTSLVESICAMFGDRPRKGSVEDGTTLSDFTDTEKARHHSVSLALASVAVRDASIVGDEPVTLTLVDTPGHADFVGEVRASLRAADAAIFVVSAVDGVDAATATAWRECAAVGMPRAVAVTHADQMRGDFAETVAAAVDVFGDGVHPVNVPLGDETLNLLNKTVRGAEGSRDATDDEMDQYEDVRAETVEAIITESEDEGMLDRYVGGEEVGFDQLAEDLRKAVARGDLFPVLCVNPVTDNGVHGLVRVLTRALPTPEQHRLPQAFTPAGELVAELQRGPDAPLVAEVIKTMTDPYVGRVSMVRVFCGTLTPESTVHVSGHLAQFSGDSGDERWHASHDTDVRTGTVSAVHGATFTPLKSAPAGTIVAVSHVDGAETGDTLSAEERPVVVEPWTFGHPYLPTAIKATSVSDEDKLMRGLARLQAEHPTVMVEVDPDTKQLVVWTMGETQLDLMMETLLERDGVTVETEEVRVAMRETVRAPASAVGRHVKQSGGHGQYAIANVSVEPLPAGSGFEFVDEVVGGAVPKQFIPSVEAGVKAQMAEGVLAYPMVDVRVRLTGGKAHSVDSSDAAFQAAGATALREAAKVAGIQLLEPVDEVTVTVDEAFVGAVLSDLAARRARIRSTETSDDGSRAVVTAEVPSFEMVRYPLVLRSVAHGTGEFERTPSAYWPAPAALHDRLAMP